MKRSGIYIAVILILLSGSHLNGFAQVESIQMTYPIKDTISDPVDEALIIQIELDSYFIWENTPPDSIGFFSLDNNYSWVKKDVTNTTLFQPEYKSVAPVYSFTREINTIYFWLFDPDNEIDTISGFDITYNKPQVELLSVTPADQVPGKESYVVYESKPVLTINAESWFPSADVNSFITKIQIKDESTSFFYTLWEDVTGAGQKEIEVELPAVFTLEHGILSPFSLRAVGRTANGYTGPVETSEEFPFSLTYMTIDVPDTICQVNSNIYLEAYPPGGSFEGNGIVDNTNLFNPFLAEANTYNPVTYSHIIDGAEFSVMKDIYVIDLPVVELDGQLEVCANSTDVVYTILNAETSKYDYIWDFTGVAEILDSTDISRTVRWQADPASYSGKISISLEGKNETQCPAAFDYLVDIDPDDAPDKPCVCFGDINKRLLLSSNTLASYYEWYILDGDLIGSSETPYFYLTDDIRKYNNIDNSTIFYVHIANQLTGCYTTGYMCEEQMCTGAQLTGMLIDDGPRELSVSIRANPVHYDLYLNSSGTYLGNFTLNIYSINGNLVRSLQLSKQAVAEDYQITLKSELKPGFYILVADYGKTRTSPVKMIVY